MQGADEAEAQLARPSHSSADNGTAQSGGSNVFSMLFAPPPTVVFCQRSCRSGHRRSGAVGGGEM